MVNGPLNFGSASQDLAFERCDALFQFCDGEVIDVLPDELVHRIVGALREKIVRLHRHSVDPDEAHVNKPLVC